MQNGEISWCSNDHEFQLSLFFKLGVIDHSVTPY